jgi:hypothetical protein
MMETISFGLMGLSVLVAVVSFISAHKSPLPDFSKMGCSGALALLVIGFLAGLYPPVSQYRGCTSACDAVASGQPASFEAAVDYKKIQKASEADCIKGAKAADRKSKQIADKEGDPSLYTPMDMKATMARCRAISIERCSSACYTGNEEG